MLKTAIKKTAITMVLSCFLIFVILMSVVPVSVLAVNGDINSMGNTVESKAEPKEIKFIGTLTFQKAIIGWVMYYFKVDTVLEGSISIGDEIRVMVYCSANSNPLDNYDYPLETGDKAEIYATGGESKVYDGYLDREVWIASITSSPNYYVKKIDDNDMNFHIGMFINPGEPVNINTELLSKLEDNGITRIFVYTYEANTGTKKHVFYAEKNGVGLDFVEVTKDTYNLNALLTEAHELNIEVHAWVACFGPIAVGPSYQNQEKVELVVEYLLTNYRDNKGRCLDGIHLDYVRFIKPFSADGDTDTIAFFLEELKGKVGNRAKLSASVLDADHMGDDDCPTDRDYCWAGDYLPVTRDEGQNYTTMSKNLDFISPMAYHYSKYYNHDPNYVGSVTKFVKKRVVNNCDVIPDIQVWCEGEHCKGEAPPLEEPGPNDIYNALNSAKNNGAKGANIFRYIHLSDDEWLAIKRFLEDHPSESEPKLCTSPDPPSTNFGTVPKDQTRTRDFFITNSGSGTLTWTITCDQPSWLNVNPTMGSPTALDVVTVTIDTHDLSPGTHTGDITLTSNGGEKTGTITVTVPPPAQEPKLCTAPDPQSTNFGTVPKDQTRTWDFFITNCGSGTLTWTITCDQPSWLKVNRARGSTTTLDVVTVTIDTHDLTPGPHTGQITITSNGGEKTGTITVNVPSKPSTPNVGFKGIVFFPCTYKDFTGQGIEVTNILSDPNGKLANSKNICAYWTEDTLAQIDNVACGEEVEVYGTLIEDPDVAEVWMIVRLETSTHYIVRLKQGPP